MRFLIIEQDLDLAESLRGMLCEYGCLSSGSYLISQILHDNSAIKTADLVFLGLNSVQTKEVFDIAQQCLNSNVCLMFLVDEADSSSIKSAMAYEPLGLILKPLRKEEVFKSIEMAKMLLLKNHLLIKDGHDHVKLNFRDIVYFKAENVYTEIVTKTKRFLPRISLSEIHSRLADGDFFQVHRSYIVNLRFVERIAKDYLILNGERVPLSRSKKSELLQSLN